MANHYSTNTLRLIYLFLLFGLLSLAFVILKPFLVPLGWAVILVISTWPIYKRLQLWMPNRPGLTAGIMCSLATLLILLTIVPMAFQLSSEAKEATKYITRLYQHERLEIPEKLLKLPFIGQRVGSLQEQWNTHRLEVVNHALTYQTHILNIIAAAAKGIGRTIFTVFIMIFSAFFLFRNGTELAQRLLKACHAVGGDSLEHLVELVHSTIIATVYGVILTAIAQGFLAGVGFFIVGTPAPVLLGIFITLLSFIPFGPPLLYLPVVLGMGMFGGSWPWAIFLLIWCTFLVSMADNVLRPLFISQATSMSLLLVLLGILGGIATFGMIGIFIGPVVIAICQKVWTEFTQSAMPLKEEPPATATAN